MLRDKETFEHVGWELWWEGFGVGEEYWEPKLKEAAAAGSDIEKLRPLLALWRSGGGEEDETPFEKLQRQIPATLLHPQIHKAIKRSRDGRLFENIGARGRRKIL